MNNTLSEFKRKLDSAVREYESAITRAPLDEDEIRRAVDKCAVARDRYNAEESKHPKQ